MRKDPKKPMAFVFALVIREIEQAFDDLYNALSDKTLKEKDAIIDLVCTLCRLHQQSGFTAALKLAHRLSQELNT